MDGECFDLWDHHVGLVASDHLKQGIGIGHRQHFGHVSHLHGRGTVIAITGDHLAAKPLGSNGHFLAQLPAAQQHHGAWKRRHGDL